jgi:5-methyltetrahydrofolate--homocysteine methyltransferase
LLAERILVLEGPKGTAIQTLELSEEDFRGELLKDHPRDIRGDNDVLGLTRPDIVESIHRDYLAAGAWILSTNTFNGSPVSQAEYGLEHLVYDMNRAAAENARRALDGAEDRFVVGSLGPTNRTLSISPKVEDPAFRTITFDELTGAYAEQIRGLVDGGVDLLQIETIFDTLNAKAAIAAAQDVAPDLPLWLSFTAVDQSGRNLSGQTAEAFWLSIEHAQPMIVGVNCSLGAAQMRPYLEALSRIAPTYTACYPNAGLPNAMGLHDEDPEITSGYLGEFARAGLANILGGCCGTTPEHIRQIAEAIHDLPPRTVPDPDETFTSFSGLEPFVVRPDTGFVMVGERQNITGSKKFRRLIESGDFQAAVDIAREQVQNGANLLDVNMDTDLLDGPQAMTTYLNLLATEPEVARVPIMVDSSSWDVIEAGLKCVQGKGVVNSISLKEGEEDFLDKARRVQRYGAAVVVMAFDEQGQADCSPSRPATTRRTSSSTRTSSRSPPAWRSTRTTRDRSSTRPASSSGGVPE